MKRLRRHTMTIAEGATGALLVILAIPAIFRALCAFDGRITLAIFAFVVALVLSRDHHAFDSPVTLARRLWGKTRLAQLAKPQSEIR